MTLQISAATEQRLHHLAAQIQRAPADLAQEGLDLFLAHREALEQSVEKGRSAARNGELIDHEEAMAMMDQVIANG